jgi:iron(III) transport system substrate-binding protein
MPSSALNRRRLLGLGPGLLAASVLPMGRLHAQSAVSGTLVLYTSQPDRDARETIAAFNKRHPNVKVEVFRSGTTEVMNRLRTEFAAGAPRPDVLLIADAISMEALKAEGRLARMRHLDTVQIPARYFDTERTYMGTKMIGTGLAINTRAGATRPAAWKDLLDPAWRGQIVMPSPLYSGAAAITVGAWTRHPELGWKFVEDLKANGAIAVRGNGAVLQQVANGEKRVGVLVDFMAYNARGRGSPIDFVVPREGLSFVTEPVAILNTARNMAAAEAFVAFLVSPEGQQFSSSLGYYPLLNGVTPPQGYPRPESLRFMNQPVEAMLASAEADRKRFADIFGG